MGGVELDGWGSVGYSWISRVKLDKIGCFFCYFACKVFDLIIKIKFKFKIYSNPYAFSICVRCYCVCCLFYIIYNDISSSFYSTSIQLTLI